MSNNILTTKANNPTTAIFGVKMDGKPYVEDISSGPHWLVAGTTGSGKSVSVNGMLISCLYHATPDELQIFAIDPKKVEFGMYAGLPFLPVDPITTMGDAYGLLAYLVLEMDARYAELEKYGFKNIDTYNEWVVNNPKEVEKLNNQIRKDNSKLEKGTKEYQELYQREIERMKFVICVIDEYAELTEDPNSQGCDELIQSLAQKARASGIHLIVATQRPSADVMSPTIRSNIPSRIGLRVSDTSSSNIILGEVPEGMLTADQLKGKGDSIVKDASGEFTRVQAHFISEEETKSLFDYLKDKYERTPFIDYKQIVIDDITGRVQVEWEEDYDENTPWEDKHVKKARRRRGGFGR